MVLLRTLESVQKPQVSRPVRLSDNLLTPLRFLFPLQLGLPLWAVTCSPGQIRGATGLDWPLSAQPSLLTPSVTLQLSCPTWPWTWWRQLS